MDFVEQLKSSVDIVKVVGDYVRLRKLGNSYKGLCPFHNERTPSFNVHAVKQYFKCFGCGKSGDLINFVMEIESIPFYEALTMLAERNGIPMPKRADFSDPESKQRATYSRAGLWPVQWSQTRAKVPPARTRFASIAAWPSSAITVTIADNRQRCTAR